MAAEASAGRWRDLGVRGLSAAILIPAVLADVWLGAWWFAAMIGLLGVLAGREYVRLTLPGDKVQFALHAGAALCGAMLLIPVGMMGALAGIVALWLVSAGLMLREKGLDAFSLLGAGYVGLPCLALVALRDDPASAALSVYWLFAVVWSADTLAYFAGRLIGGPKLWPAVSPKKTWAGLGGAVVGAVLASLLVMAIAGKPSTLALSLCAGLLALIEQGGDLYESALKRRAGVKDSGSLIPGHGGMLDRVDGLLAAAIGALVLSQLGMLAW